MSAADATTTAHDDPVAEIQLLEAIDDARTLGVKVGTDMDPQRFDDGGRVRAEVGRHLDDGVFYILLNSDQSAAEKLRILHVCMERVGRFEEEQWQVEIGLVSTAYVNLGDAADGTPAELLRDIPRWVRLDFLRSR